MQTVIDVVDASTAAMFDGTWVSATVSSPGPPTSIQTPIRAAPADLPPGSGRSRSASGAGARPRSEPQPGRQQGRHGLHATIRIAR